MKNQKTIFTFLILAFIFFSCRKAETLKPILTPPKPLDETYKGAGSYASAAVPHGDTIKSFSTSWIVPSTPPRDSTIFWWNGLDGGALQPVLQWENGNWTIANWYYLKGYHHGKFVPVKSGTHLTGIIQLVSFTTDSFTYKESFVGYPDADVTFTRPTLATSLVECQEAYTNTFLAFPSDPVVRMTGIKCVVSGKTPLTTLNWVTGQPLAKTPTGHLAFVVASNSASNGEVDFYIK